MTDAETTRPWPETDVEALLDTPYRIIDLFPRRVPEDCAKAYLRAEAWFLEPPRIKSLRQRQAALLVRLGFSRLKCIQPAAAAGHSRIACRRHDISAVLANVKSYLFHITLLTFIFVYLAREQHPDFSAENTGKLPEQ